MSMDMPNYTPYSYGREGSGNHQKSLLNYRTWEIFNTWMNQNLECEPKYIGEIFCSLDKSMTIESAIEHVLRNFGNLVRVHKD